MATRIYEPFVGLTYDGVHSSELGLYRVSDGSRYNEDLLPSFSDKTTERTGADGMYFFGSNYQQKNWTIEFAFDHITKEQLLEIKKLFGAGAKKPKQLIFDEDREYNSIEVEDTIELIHNHNLGEISEDITTEEPPMQRYYLAKVAQPPQLKTLCFDELDDEGNIVDIYKGELTVEFTSYTPFAYAPITEKVPDNNEILYKNLGSIRVSPQFYFKTNVKEGISFKLYSSEEANIPTEGSSTTVYIYPNALIAENITLADGEDGLIVDCEVGIIYGAINGVKTTNIYNSYITSGHFFDLPLSVGSDDKITIQCTNLTCDKMIFQEKYY